MSWVFDFEFSFFRMDNVKDKREQVQEREQDKSVDDPLGLADKPVQMLIDMCKDFLNGECAAMSSDLIKLGVNETPLETAG